MILLYHQGMIRRISALVELQKSLKSFPVVAILGPRQCGKTTLAREMNYTYDFDLENPRDFAQFEHPQLALENLEGLVLIDEIQRKPNLFALIRHLVDKSKKQKFLILGSASRDLIQQSSESLAGRIFYYELTGFNLQEVKNKNLQKLWHRGSFPRSYLASSQTQSWQWRESYIQTFLERDIPQLGIQIPAHTLRKFWMMLSHYHGQILNYSELGRSFGISDMTVKKYLDILEGTFMIRLLQPWHSNTSKRLVKSPKLYLRDSGLLHNLLSLENPKSLLSHPKLGASWEGFALEQVANLLKIGNERLFFWATHAGAELDLFWQRNGKSYGIEFKYSDAPLLSKSMQIALEDLELTHLWVIYPGSKKYPLDKKITTLPLTQISELL